MGPRALAARRRVAARVPQPERWRHPAGRVPHAVAAVERDVRQARPSRVQSRPTAGTTTDAGAPLTRSAIEAPCLTEPLDRPAEDREPCGERAQRRAHVLIETARTGHAAAVGHRDRLVRQYQLISGHTPPTRRHTVMPAADTLGNAMVMDWSVGGMSLRLLAVITRPVHGYARREASIADAGERPHARAPLKPANSAGIRGLDHPLYPISRHSASVGAG